MHVWCRICSTYVDLFIISVPSETFLMHLEVIVALDDIEARVFPKGLTDRDYEPNKKVHEVEKALEIPDQLLIRQNGNLPNTNGAFRNVLK